MEFEVIEPHGFCEGVRAAVCRAERALACGTPVYCLHELVHNESVVDGLRRRGMRFVEDVDEVPEGATMLVSAHGAPPEAMRRAEARRLKVVDATCPFVARAHRQARTLAAQGIPVVVVGDPGHVEVRGIVGECGSGDLVRVVADAGDVAALTFHDDVPVGVVCQTTLLADRVERVMEALRARYRRLAETPASETCTATRDRQEAVRTFVGAAPGARAGVLVAGSARSANTARLLDVARSAGARAWRVDGPEDLAGCDFSGTDRLGVTAGASTPEAAVAAICDALARKDGTWMK